MKPTAPPIISHIVIFLLGVITLFVYAFCDTPEKDTFEDVHRIVIALAAAAVSIGLPGILHIGNPPVEKIETKTIIEDGKEIEKRTISKNQAINIEIHAAGALAVFVLVYLFDPITI